MVVGGISASSLEFEGAAALRPLPPLVRPARSSALGRAFRRRSVGREGGRFGVEGVPGLRGGREGAEAEGAVSDQSRVSEKSLEIC